MDLLNHGVCPRCGEEFTRRNPTQRYCSTTCKKAAAKKRRLRQVQEQTGSTILPLSYPHVLAANPQLRQRIDKRQRDILDAHPLLPAGKLGELFGVTRQTVMRWRVCGFLPKPIKCGSVGFFWPASTIEQWVLDGCPWANKRAAAVALRHAKERGAEGFDELNEKLAPIPLDDETRPIEAKPEIAALLDEMEDALNKWELTAAIDDVPTLPKPQRLQFVATRLLDMCHKAEEQERQQQDWWKEGGEQPQPV